jgi:hypothetical protein
VEAHEKVLRWVKENLDGNLLQLARMTGVPQPTLQSGLKSPKPKLTIKVALKLFRPMGVKLEWLVDDERPYRPVLKLDDKGEALTDEQREILKLAERIGPEDAWKRLMVQAPYAKMPLLMSEASEAKTGVREVKEDSDGDRGKAARKNRNTGAS